MSETATKDSGIVEMKIYVWCSECAEFHEAKQVENPLGGDALVWTDKCGHIVVVSLNE